MLWTYWGNTAKLLRYWCKMATYALSRLQYHKNVCLPSLIICPAKPEHLTCIWRYLVLPVPVSNVEVYEVEALCCVWLEMIGNSVLERVKRHTPHLREIQRPLVFTYFRTLASIFTLYRPRIIYNFFSLLFIYFNVFVCYLFSKQLDYFNSCLFIPFMCPVLVGTFVKRFHFIW